MDFDFRLACKCFVGTKYKDLKLEKNSLNRNYLTKI